MDRWRARASLATLGVAVLAATAVAAGHPTAEAGTRVPSPGDNGLIAFERELPAGQHTQTDIYTVASDGTNVVRLTATPSRNEFGPAWDPAGGRIAFWRTAAPFGVGSLWVMNGDGSGARRLTTGVDARDPSWNPAADRLVYDRAADDLFTLRVSDGQDRQQLTSGPAQDFEPAWSPNGDFIAFTRGSPTGDPGDIYLLNVTTHAVTRVTHSPAYDHQVAWGPLSHLLAFERDFGDRSAIYTVRPNGTELTRRTTGQHFDVGPTFSPDGQLIAFGSDRGSTLDQLWVMANNGADPHQLLSLSYSSGFPSWQTSQS